MSKRKIAANWKNRIVGYGVVPASSFLANEGNWRIHPRNQQEGMKGALDTVGWVQDVIVNKRTSEEWGADRGVETLVDGHLRVTLALREGDDTPVPVKYVDLTPAEEAQVLASLDPLAAMAATDKAKLDELMRQVQSDDERVQAMMAEIAEKEGLEYGKLEPKEDPGAQVDKAEELREKWQVEPGQLWQLGEHFIYCGDCTSREESDRYLPGQIDMIFSDPPYGVAVNGAVKDGRQIQGDLSMAAIPASFALAFERLVPGGWVYMCGGWSNAPLWFRLFDVHCHMIPHLIVWVKETFVMRQSGYHSQYELIYVGWKQGGEHRNKHWFGDRKQSDVWTIGHSEEKGNELHPTMKPVELVEKAVNNSCPPGGIVYEPFSGSGTTLIACEQTGRKCRAVEISPAYVAVALERWSVLSGKTPHLISKE